MTMGRATRWIGAGLGLALGGAAWAQESYTVALDGTFAPHAMPTMDGGIEGFNVDLANKIGERLGAEMDIVATQFSGILPGLQAGTYDFVVAPTTITEERAARATSSPRATSTPTSSSWCGPTRPRSPTCRRLRGTRPSRSTKARSTTSWARDLEDEIGWTVESYGTNDRRGAGGAVGPGRRERSRANTVIGVGGQAEPPASSSATCYSTGLVWGMPFRKGDEDATRHRRAGHRMHEGRRDHRRDAPERWFGTEPAAEGSAAVTPRPGYGEPGFAGYVEDDHTLGL